jgi:hypothetical protein
MGATPVLAQQPGAQTILDRLEQSEYVDEVPIGVLHAVYDQNPEQLTPEQRQRLRRHRAQEGRPGRTVALPDLQVFEDQQQFYGTPWPRDDLNFSPSGIGTRAGDVTGDGTDDWIYRASSVADDRTADLSDRTPKTFLTFGEGSFSSRYYDELYYRSLQPVGNFVGTGDADSSNADAVRPLTDGGFQIYPGTSQGYVEGAVRSEPFEAPPNVAPVDLNDDGYDEVIRGVGSAPPGVEPLITVLFGGSSADAISRGAFSPPSDTGRSKRFGYAAGDVDGDDAAEIVRLQGTTDPSAQNPDDSLSVDVLSLAGPDSLARASTTLDFPDGVDAASVRLSLADVNGSGQLELIVRPSEFGPGFSGPFVLSSSGGTYQTEPVSYYPGSRPVGDINGDGRADFALRDTSDGTPHIAFGPSSVGDGLSFELEVPSGPEEASVFIGSEPQGDLDGDGRAELIVEYQTDTQFGPRRLDLPQGASSLETTDFLFDEANYGTTIGVLETVNVGDWDGDGTDDVGFVLADGRVEIYYGDPTQSISPDVTLTGPEFSGSGANYSSVATGDFTNNGTPNLAVAWESNTQTIAVYEAGSGDSPVHTVGIEDLGIPADAPGIADGEDFEDFPNSVVANLGDIDGDGTEDLGISQPEVEGDVGKKVFLYFGASSLPVQPDVTIDYSDRATGTWFGQVLRGIGDVNGDGTDDFLVGDTFGTYSGGPLFPEDPVGNGFNGALFVHYGDAGGSPTFDDPDQALAVPLVEQLDDGSFRFNQYFGWQGIAVGDFNGDDMTDVAAKPAFSSLNSTGEGAVSVRFFHGGSGFDGTPDVDLPVPGVLDSFNDTELAGSSFGSLTAVPPASGGEPTRLLVETVFLSNALIYGPGPDTTYALEKTTLLRGPDQQSGLGTGGAFINLPQSAASATGDINGSGRANIVSPQYQSADFRGAPAYAYELGTGAPEEPEPVASTSAPVDSTSGSVDFGDDTGVDITFGDGTAGGDTVRVERFDQGPSGSSGIEESTVSSYRVEIAAGEGLSVGDSTEVRFDVAMLPGIDDPTRVVIYTRELPGAGTFQKVPTSYDANADELVGLVSGFSEFAVASDTEPLPVEMAGFEATVDGDAVQLSWQTASETGNAEFQVQRRTGESANGRGGAWTTVGSVEGAGTTSQAQSYRFTDEDLPYAADALSYRLRQVDTDGSAHLSKTVAVERSVSEVQLLGTYPNPARQQATVRYALPEKQKAMIRLYDVLGRRVRTVLNDTQEGRHKQRVNVSGLPSGVYFLRLRSEGTTETQKLTIVR